MIGDKTGAPMMAVAADLGDRAGIAKAFHRIAEALGGVGQSIPTIGMSNTLHSALAGGSKTLAGEVGKDGAWKHLPRRVPATGTWTRRIPEFRRSPEFNQFEVHCLTSYNF